MFKKFIILKNIIVKSEILMYNNICEKRGMNMENKSVIKEALEWIYCIVIAVALALLVRYYLGTPTIVQQQSMETTFLSGDRLILSRWNRTTHKDYKRGDIITFEAPTTSLVSAVNADFENPVAEYKNTRTSLWSKFIYNVLETNKKSYIKRIIGVANDHIEIKDGKVYRNGEELDETYLNEGVTTTMGEYGVYSDIVVPEGYVFVMGDNRDHSMDSRCFGCIPVSKIESKVWIRFWPLSKFGKVQ